MARTETITVVFTDLVGSTENGNGRAPQMRVGASSGEATREDGDLFGTAVVEAARLCTAAAAGQIVASDVARALARCRGHIFTALGELTLKALPEPAPACEVKWEPLPEETPVRVPLPPRLTVAATVALVGREAEQDVIASAHGQPGVAHRPGMRGRRQRRECRRARVPVGRVPATHGHPTLRARGTGRSPRCWCAHPDHRR